MDEENRRDIKILGDSTVSSGFYADMKITGDVVMDGDVDCINLMILGDCTANDNLKVKTGKITGDLDVAGSLTADDLDFKGDVTVGRDAAIGDSQFYGDVTIHGDLTTEKADIKGDLQVKGNCSSDVFKSCGDLQIGGLLSADDIDIELHGESKIGEIGGGRISIRRGSESLLRKWSSEAFGGSGIALTTDTIEGDEVYLEYTAAKTVCGNDVTIGPGCRIELVEYKDKYSQSDDAVVKQNKRII